MYVRPVVVVHGQRSWTLTVVDVHACAGVVQFRIKSVDGEYFRAETVACMTDKGVVCSTRVDRPI